MKRAIDMNSIQEVTWKAKKFDELETVLASLRQEIAGLRQEIAGLRGKK